MTAMTETETLECICGPDTTPGSYVLGCAFHVAQKLAAPSTIATRIGTAQITVWKGRIDIETPVLADHYGKAVVATSTRRRACDHAHTTPEAAEVCSRRMALAQRKVQGGGVIREGR